MPRTEAALEVNVHPGAGAQRLPPANPGVHGRPAQQSALVVQSWPYMAHGVGMPLSVPVAASVGTPASGTGVPLHVPLVLPGGIMHRPPGQQSALVVHGPAAGTQGVSKHTSVPVGLRTHGCPLQQFALVEHVPPGFTHVAPAQRGTPRMSGMQVSPWQLPAQQSQRALHDDVAVRQTLPSG